MRIGYISDLNMRGCVPESVNDLRSDISWMKTLGLFHFSFSYATSHLEEVNSYDIIIINHPKDKEGYFDKIIPFLFSMLDNPKKGLVQHGGYDCFMNWSTASQACYIRTLRDSDFFVVTNDDDIEKFRLLAPDTKIIFLPTDLDKKVVEALDTKDREDQVMIGGNLTPWYAGTLSVLVAEKFGLPITMPSMGRKRVDEEEIIKGLVKQPITYIPYLPWSTWFRELSRHKYAVNLMPVAACGSFVVACAALGIPCIGRSHVTAQRECFPQLCIDEDYLDIDKKVLLAQREYTKISSFAKTQFKKYFERQSVRDFVFEQFKSLK